jgi:hypothetical protein
LEEAFFEKRALQSRKGSGCRFTPYFHQKKPLLVEKWLF